MNNRETGARYEALAAAYLMQEGFQILEKNYRIRSGEIDLIAREGRYLVFIEVKYRSSLREGSPLEAVNQKKQRVIIQTARHYLLSHGYSEDTPCRFDVVGMDGDRVTHIRDAFWAE
ncbi:MAG: YraN family protein [Eubacteriales bacterium]|nr:YraN family protein [Eubacteriales bacterium]